MDPVFSHAAVGALVVTFALMIVVYLLRLVFGHVAQTYRSKEQS